MTDLDRTADEQLARRLFERTARTMVPAPAPMTRLTARRRRFRARRLIGTASVLVVLLGGGALAQTAAPHLPIPGPFRIPSEGDVPGQEIRSEWTRRLIESPTRGNLATDRALVDTVTTAFGRHWYGTGTRRPDRARISRDLDRVRLLFLHEAGRQRQAVAVFYNDTHAAVVSLIGAADADPDRMVATADTYSGGVAADPFLLLNEAPVADSVVALAPAGCDIAVSDAVDVDPGGAAHRNWTGLGDWTIRPARSGQDWWQVTCDGRVQYRQPVSRYPEVTPDPASPTTPQRGTVEPAMAARAAGAWRISGHGLGSTAVLLWGGVPPGGTEPVAVVATPTAGGGVAVLALTGDGSFPVFADGPDSRRIEGPPDTETDTAVTTGTATAGITVVRLPDPSGAVSDRLLVIAPPDAQSLRSTATADPVPLVDGVAVLTAPRPLHTQIDALRNGAVLASMRLQEPTSGPSRFGIELIDRW
jgi:hypothetical protein